jgi:hypothetical protein
VGAAGELRFARYYTDNLVVQRDKPAVVAGFAASHTAVTVSFAGQKKTATADASGRWTVTLDPLPVNVQPQTLTVEAGQEQVALKNVLVGDVFLFARQTSVPNAESKTRNGEPRLRAISIQTLPAADPQSDLAAEATSGWTTAPVSAAADYLGRELAATVQVPVGIVDVNLGRAFPIAWLSREALLETEKFYGKSDVEGLVARMDKLVELQRRGAPMPAKEVTGPEPVQYPLFPAGGYNAVLHPLRGLAWKAALIQLGNDYPYLIYADLERAGKHLDREELNRAYVQTYDIRKVGFRMEPVTTPRIPREWRNVFGDKELPVGLILPPGSDLETEGQHLREMRELQRWTARDNPGVGVILPGMANLPKSAQPADEKLLAARCASWVQGAVYRQPDVPATGPLFERLEANLNQATIHFAPGTARGLRAAAGALDFFEVAGVEGDYAPARASLAGETIRLQSATVNRITRARYNWNHRPNEGLVNAAGLPAIPFRSERVAYHWFVTNKDDDLPIEYHTPANEWAKNDVTLVNGQLKTHGYKNFTGWLGPVGVKTGPFGPNMGVRQVSPGSPADGKLFVGDVIYSANGQSLGDQAWEVMGAAITASETEAGQGKLVLGVRRDGQNREVELTLRVMGTYSSTAPYDCPKTEKIITDLENWLVARGGGEGFLNTDALFLLATGNPKVQGLVRRVVYAIVAKLDLTKPIDPENAGKSWFNSADAFLLGEYYLATGDRHVLPALKYFCDRLAATQNPAGGWRHNFPGGEHYGLIPNAGLPGVMGMHFAQTAGLPIQTAAYERGVRHFGHKRAETGFLIYGLGGCEREKPPVFDPADLAAGRLETYNGGLSAAGILMGLTGDYRAAHLCSFISAYAWNNTFGGHGGNFWNNFWTPLGAHQHGRAAFIHFWKNYRWYRECHRMFDGSLIQHEDGKVGAGTGVALVAPRQRLQIVGAPRSPFAANAPDFLQPALAAYEAQKYAQCERQVNELLATGLVGKDERPTVEFLARAAREIQESIAADLDRVEALIQQGNYAEASLDLPQLQGVVPAGDARRAALEAALATPAATEAIRKTKPAKPSLVTATTPREDPAAAARDWQCLVTEIATARSQGGAGKVPAAQANVWRLQVIEDMGQAPAHWTQPGFDDSGWDATTLPISWRMYHTALLRTKFTVPDKAAFDGLRFRAWLFRQQAIEIHLNGQLVAKVNNLEEKTGNVEAEFNSSVLQHLRTGENTLAITTRHNWRWGMLSMHVYNDGFGFRLDARKK